MQYSPEKGQMTITIEELREKFAQWKSDKRIVRAKLEFVQDSLTSISAWMLVNDCVVTDEEIKFSFGRKYAGGELVIPISDKLDFDDSISQRSKSLFPSSEQCVTITWKDMGMDENQHYCIVCVQRES